jgi:hypothetical protein
MASRNDAEQVSHVTTPTTTRNDSGSSSDDDDDIDNTELVLCLYADSDPRSKKAQKGVFFDNKEAEKDTS